MHQGTDHCTVVNLAAFHNQILECGNLICSPGEVNVKQSEITGCQRGIIQRFLIRHRCFDGDTGPVSAGAVNGYGAFYVNRTRHDHFTHTVCKSNSLFTQSQRITQRFPQTDLAVKNVINIFACCYDGARLINLGIIGRQPRHNSIGSRCLPVNSAPVMICNIRGDRFNIIRKFFRGVQRDPVAGAVLYRSGKRGFAETGRGTGNHCNTLTEKGTGIDRRIFVKCRRIDKCQGTCFSKNFVCADGIIVGRCRHCIGSGK